MSQYGKNGGHWIDVCVKIGIHDVTAGGPAISCANHINARAGRRRRTRAPALDEAGNPLPKKPSVFTKPQQITDDLCVFLGKSKGTQISRSDVTRGVMDYVKKHGLNNKQDINPDAALRKLLKVTEAEKVTILNLQRYLKNHYVKAPTA
jgi:chromatin remodeling complex protein RSC6